jgi:hypothetical protein
MYGPGGAIKQGKDLPFDVKISVSSTPFNVSSLLISA